MSSKISRLLPGGEPSYTMHVWHRNDGNATAGLSGPEDWEPDYLEIADDLIAFANGFIEQSGYKSAWYQGLIDERWYVATGFIMGAALVGLAWGLVA